MTQTNKEHLLEQLAKRSFFSLPEHAEMLRSITDLPQSRPVVSEIDTYKTVVVCRREILAEAITYYTAKYGSTPVFYTFSPDASLYDASADVTVEDFYTLTPEQDVHIFSLTS